MRAEHAGHARLDRRLDRVDRPRDHLRRVADQRRQQPVVPNRRCASRDRGHARDIGLVVEQHVAAAIDLGVDEPRQQPAAAQILNRTSAGRSSAGTIAAIRPASISTACPSTVRSGSTIVAPVSAVVVIASWSPSTDAADGPDHGRARATPPRPARRNSGCTRWHGAPGAARPRSAIFPPHRQGRPDRPPRIPSPRAR